MNEKKRTIYTLIKGSHATWSSNMKIWNSDFQEMVMKGVYGHLYLILNNVCWLLKGCRGILLLRKWQHTDYNSWLHNHTIESQAEASDENDLYDNTHHYSFFNWFSWKQ